ncbi:hypothetical protein Tco_1517117 [Tanacetum coccineum]
MNAQRSFIQEKPPPPDSKKGYQYKQSQESVPGANQWTRVAVAQQLPRSEGRGSMRGTTSTPTDNDPKRDLATEDWDHPVKNIRKGKDKQRQRRQEDAPRDQVLTPSIWLLVMAAGKTSKNGSRQSTAMYIEWRASADSTVRTLLQRLCPEVKRSTPQTAWMNFMVIRSPSPYNWIIGRTRDLSDTRRVPFHGPWVAINSLSTGSNSSPSSNRRTTKECNTVTCDVTQTQRQTTTK